MSLYAAGSSYADGIIEYDFYYEPWTAHYFASSEPPTSYDSLRDRFIGPYRSETNPIAVERGEGSNVSATTQNHCGALFHKRAPSRPGETKRLAYVLGHGYRDEVGRGIQAKYADLGNGRREFARMRAHWRAKQDKLRIRTPHEGMNTLINTWTLLQAETCVQWSRFASFVEVGGRTGLGYRDTSQDVMSVLHTNPAKARSRIMELLRAQTEAGYGLHLFDPNDFDPDAATLHEELLSPTVVPTRDPASLIHGLDDTSSDSHLWLVPSVVEFVRETGDLSFLDLEVPFAEGTSATVYEHLRRALDFTSRHIGTNGVAQGLRADWNDCLNLGGGETALVTFLHAWAIRSFLEVAEHLGRTADVDLFTAELDRITEVCRTDLLWDGEWWIRGFTAAGVKIGSAENAEGKIFLEHQAWPVLAGITSAGARRPGAWTRCAELLGSAVRAAPELAGVPAGRRQRGLRHAGVSGREGERRDLLATPTPGRSSPRRSSGAGTAAVELYDAILPYRQNDEIEVRGAEPYAYVQFVYGRDHELYGRAQNPWLTGTAGWMYTAVTKWILGVRPTLAGLVVDPCIPTAWDGFEVQRQWRGTTYLISVTNPEHVSSGVVGLRIDGIALEPGSPIGPAEEGATVSVEVVLGVGGARATPPLG